MQLPKECNIIFQQCKWESLKTDICLKNERKILPKHWTDVIRKEIKKIKDFSCCVKFIRHLADDKKTNMETGCLSVKSKNVFRQAKYEWSKKKLSDEDIFKSLEILKKNYADQSKSK